MTRMMVASLLLAFLIAPVSPEEVFAQSFLKQGEDLLKGLESSGRGGALSDAEIGAGLKEALEVGFRRVVNQVGALDGFNADPEIHIPLPGALQRAQQALGAIGQSSMADDLELRLNRAAETAVPEATESFLDAIATMELEDVQRIYNGREDEATRFFRERMTPDLVERFTPIVNDALSEVGAIRSYEQMMSSYKTLPFVPDVKSDLSSYTVEKAMDGLFHYLAQEEAAIRSNPAARTTELLQKVFGGA